MASDMMADGIAWLENQMQIHAAVEVVYGRGGATVNLRATLGRTEFDVRDEYGNVRIEKSDADFIVPAADLILAGDVITPQKADVITRVIGSKTYTYQVLAPAGQQVFKQADPYGRMLRVHTKLKAVV